MAYLNNHINVVHEQIQFFKCKICTKGFSTKGNLKKHINAIHGKNKVI